LVGTGVESSSPLVTELCADLKLAPIEMAEIYRYLGYPRGTTPGLRIVKRVQQLVHDSLPHLAPQGTFSVYRINQRRRGFLELGGVTISGDIEEYMAHANRLAVFAVTVGDAISARATSARERDAFATLVLDSVGSWGVEAAADALMERIGRHLGSGEALTLRYSPGYCGMALSEQRNLFRLLRGDSVGVTLLPSMVMQPLKSVSGLVGMGSAEQIIRYRSACDRCPQIGCHMRR